MTEHDLLAKLHTVLAEQLLERVTDPEAKSADLNVARQFLKDNGIEALASKGSPLADLVNTLPDFTDEDADLTEMQRHYKLKFISISFQCSYFSRGRL